jgi:hypothetical protein
VSDTPPGAGFGAVIGPLGARFGPLPPPRARAALFHRHVKRETPSRSDAGWGGRVFHRHEKRETSSYSYPFGVSPSRKT